MKRFPSYLAPALCGIALSTLGCNTAPRLDVEVRNLSRSQVRLFEDGTEIRDADDVPSSDTWSLMPGYYGRVRIEAEGPRDAEHASDRTEARALVDFGPPAPGWIFPFDFLVEATKHLLRGPTTRKATLELPNPADETRTVLDPSAIESAIQATRQSAVAR